MKTVIWLPNLTLLSEYENSWEKYLDALYLFYTEDFIDSKPIFRGQKLAVKNIPYLMKKKLRFGILSRRG